MGKSLAAALMAAWTSRAAPSTFRFKSNWMVTEHPPRVLTDVISVTPAIWARRRSSGAASEDATVAGSAPGRLAETLIIGKSTRGMAATGMSLKATTPAMKRPMASNEVPTGRRMNGAQTFMRGEGRSRRVGGRNPKAEGRKKSEVRSPKSEIQRPRPTLRRKGQQVGELAERSEEHTSELQSLRHLV